MVAKAKEMVAEAKRIGGKISSSLWSKSGQKADWLDDESSDIDRQELQLR